MLLENKGKELIPILQELKNPNKIKEQSVQTDRVLCFEESKKIALSKDSESQSQEDIAPQEVPSMKDPKPEIKSTKVDKKKKKRKRNKKKHQNNKPPHDVDDKNNGDENDAKPNTYEERKIPIFSELDPRSELTTLPSLTASGESHPNELQASEAIQELMSYSHDKKETSNASQTMPDLTEF